MAHDGGWWVLGVTDAGDGRLPADDSDVATRHRRCNAGGPARHGYQTWTWLRELADVDTVDDVDAVRRACAPEQPVRACHPGGGSLTCSATSTTARWTANAVGSATTTAACTGCRCAAGSAASTPIEKFDHAVVGLCHGPTIDLGCGPGRLVAHLIQRGVPALGVDQSATAVELARRSGAPGPAPRRVRTAAGHRPVADGAAGRRQRRPWRRPVADAAAGGRTAAPRRPVCGRIRLRPSAGIHAGWVRLESSRTIGPWFRWASVGIDCVTRLADDVGLAVTGSPPDRRPGGGQPGGDMKTATLRGTAVTARVGLWLGVAVAVCFVTGLISHFIQHPQPWFFWPTRPVWLYRVTQGLHVISRHRGDTADCRQAVVGVAEAVRASADRRAGPSDRAVVDPGAGRVDAVSAVAPACSTSRSGMRSSSSSPPAITRCPMSRRAR